MRALVYTEKRTLDVLDVPDQDVGAGDVAIRVAAAGICGSDVHGVASRSPRRTPPLIMGHELAGEVTAVGPGVPESLVGRLVAVNPQVPCGLCTPCRSGRENVCQDRGMIGGTRPGGFGEHVTVPLRCVHVMPEGTDPMLAVFAEPLATCVHAAALAGRTAPSSAVVFGAGTIGVLMAQMLRLIGTGWLAVSDVDAGRREHVAQVADVACAPDELEAVVGARGGLELTVDCAGTADTRYQSVRLLDTLGTAVWIGMHDQDSAVPAFEVVVREQRVQGSFAYTNPEFARAVELLVSGELRPAITSSVVSLEESGDAFRALLGGVPTGFLKSIVTPGGAAR
jgi:threonine dehydrogenase-like Zn-dependent dehydrogenase